MKTNVQVYVLREFEWKGQTYQPGELIQLSVPDALALGKKKHITVTRKKAFMAATPDPPSPPPVPEPEPISEKPKRGKYKRRDLQPEEMAVMTADAPAEVPDVSADVPPVDE